MGCQSIAARTTTQTARANHVEIRANSVSVLSPRAVPAAKLQAANIPTGKTVDQRRVSWARDQMVDPVVSRSGGGGMSKRMGFPVVLLTTRGAKSGQPRATPVGVFTDGENSWLVVASLAGAARHPAWFLNMAKHPDDIWLEVGREKFRKSRRSRWMAPSVARRYSESPRSRRGMATTRRRPTAKSRSCALRARRDQ